MGNVGRAPGFGALSGETGIRRGIKYAYLHPMRQIPASVPSFFRGRPREKPPPSKTVHSIRQFLLLAFVQIFNF